MTAVALAPAVPKPRDPQGPCEVCAPLRGRNLVRPGVWQARVATHPCGCTLHAPRLCDGCLGTLVGPLVVITCSTHDTQLLAREWLVEWSAIQRGDRG